MATYKLAGDLNATKIAVVIEDSPTSMIFLSKILARLKYKVLEFKTPRLAIKWFEVRSEEIKPSFIISDIIMPEMTGIDLLKECRERNFQPGVPFILLTSKVEREYILEAKKLGVAGYIVKPATPEKISSKLKEIFS